MIESDNTRIDLDLERLDDRTRNEVIKKYKNWFIERNIKYSFDRFPPWWVYPTSVILRNEDALLFKLTFGL